MEKKACDSLKTFSANNSVRKRIWQTERLHCNLYCSNHFAVYGETLIHVLLDRDGPIGLILALKSIRVAVSHSCSRAA